MRIIGRQGYSFRIYIASPFFTPHQRDIRDTILESLKGIEVTLNNHPDSPVEFEVFSPEEVFVCPSDAEPLTRKKTFKGNCDGIEASDLVIAATTDKDMGTIWEAGYACANEVPVVYVNFDVDIGGFNLMLAESGIFVATNQSQLTTKLIRWFQNEFKKFEEYQGEIE